MRLCPPYLVWSQTQNHIPQPTLYTHPKPPPMLSSVSEDTFGGLQAAISPLPDSLALKHLCLGHWLSASQTQQTLGPPNNAAPPPPAHPNKQGTWETGGAPGGLEKHKIAPPCRDGRPAAPARRGRQHQETETEVGAWQRGRGAEAQLLPIPPNTPLSFKGRGPSTPQMRLRQLQVPSSFSEALSYPSRAAPGVSAGRGASLEATLALPHSSQSQPNTAVVLSTHQAWNRPGSKGENLQGRNDPWRPCAGGG